MVPRLVLSLAVSCKQVKRRNPCSASCSAKGCVGSFVCLSCLTLCTDVVHRLGTCSQAKRTSQYYDLNLQGDFAKSDHT